MQRMTQFPSKRISDLRSWLMLALATIASFSLLDRAAEAQFGGVVQADYHASGFVTPAGMVPPEQYFRANPYGIMPVGYVTGSACDAPYGACDGCVGGCSSCYSGGCVGGGACANGGIFGAPAPCPPARCKDSGLLDSAHCGCNLKGGCGKNGCGLSNLRCVCPFCHGQGCSACQLWNNHGASPFEFLGVFLPYTDAGICAMRWYDISAEVVWLGNTRGGQALDVTSLGVNGQRVLNTGDPSVGMEAGARISGAIICGVGGNLELTYLGGQRWKGRSMVRSDNPEFFSVVSDFGQSPPNGFDDTDRSLTQAIDVSSELHTAELNYRRRTVWPYCRFQGSWLVGFRYLKFHDRLVYATAGEFDDALGNFPRFFASNDRVSNDLLGGQIGFDFWWNMRPGISLGWGAKGAWVNNNIDRRTVLSANSLGEQIAINDNTNKSAYLGDFEVKLVYRVSHSWTFRTAYYALVLDEIGFGGVAPETIRDFVDVTIPDPRRPQMQIDSLVMQGVSWGIEYMW